MGKVGYIGVGKMGSRMVVRLLDAGHEVIVWNRPDEFYDANVGPLVEKGAKVAESPRAAARARDICFTSVANGEAFNAVCLGDEGITNARLAPALLADTSTIGPWESEEVANAAKRAGIGFLRVPVSGSTAAAEAGTLTILGSGAREDFEAAEPFLGALGSTRIYVGLGESARYLKLILNMQIYAQLGMLAEGAVLGEKGGLDWQAMLDGILASVGASPFLGYKIPPIARREYGRPHFSLRMVSKDLKLAAEAGRRAGVQMPITELITQLWDRAVGEGYGDLDASALTLTYEKMAGLEPTKV